MSETWNSSFKQLVGHSHPSFYTAIGNIRKDEAIVKTMMLQDDRGKPPKKRRKRNYARIQKRLKTLCEDIVTGRKSTEEFLRAVGQCVRFLTQDFTLIKIINSGMIIIS